MLVEGVELAVRRVVLVLVDRLGGALEPSVACVADST
jgi:hypothetical protein